MAAIAVSLGTFVFCSVLDYNQVFTKNVFAALTNRFAASASLGFALAIITGSPLAGGALAVLSITQRVWAKLPQLRNADPWIKSLFDEDASKAVKAIADKVSYLFRGIECVVAISIIGLLARNGLSSRA